MTPNFIVVANVLLPYLHIFEEEIFELLGTTTVGGVCKQTCDLNRILSNNKVKF